MKWRKPKFIRYEYTDYTGNKYIGEIIGKSKGIIPEYIIHFLEPDSPGWDIGNTSIRELGEELYNYMKSITDGRFYYFNRDIRSRSKLLK